MRLARILAYVGAVIALCAAVAGIADDVCARDKNAARISVLIATGMPGGTYYRVGLGMASQWTTRLKGKGIRVSAAISEGSRENIEAIRISDADLILAENLFCSNAYHGTGIFKDKPLSELRAITTLWQDTAHIIVGQQSVKTGALGDLQGLTVATGLPDSGSRFTTELLLRTIPDLRKGVRVRSMSELAGAEALRKRTVQALDLTGGIPIPLVTSLFAEGLPLRMLDIPDSSLEILKSEGWTHISRAVIPAKTYPGQQKPVRTVGLTAVLATTASLNPQVVYELTKTLYENLESLSAVHPACRSIALNKAMRGLDIPLHRGAIRYYQERHIEIPAGLGP